MRKKTKLLTLAAMLAFVMLLTCALGGMLAFADEGDSEPETPAPAVTETDSAEWDANSKNATVKYNPETGVYHVDNLLAWGDKAIYDRAVKLEGLKVTFDFDCGSYTNRAVGFGLTDLKGTAYPWMDANAFCATIWPTMNGAVGDQSRLFIGKSHDMNSAADPENHTADTIAYCDQALTSKSGAITHDGTLVSDLGRTAFSIQFNAVPETDVWKITVTGIAGVWSNEGSEFYVSKQYFESVMNSDGEAYVAIAGFSNDGQTVNSAYVKIEDENMRTALATADATETAYDTAIGAITDAETYAQSMTARGAFVEAIAALREFEKPAYQAKLATLDAKYTQDADVQTQVKGTVTAKVDTAAAKVTALATESNITADAITAAKADAAAEKAAYEVVKDMLTEANKTELNATFAEHDAAIAVAEAKIWILSYESRVNALESLEKSAVAAEAAKVDRYRDKYAGSEDEALITALPEADKTALEARIAAADKKLADIKAEAAKPDEPENPGDTEEPPASADSGKKCGSNLAASSIVLALAALAASALTVSVKRRRKTDR